MKVFGRFGLVVLQTSLVFFASAHSSDMNEHKSRCSGSQAEAVSCLRKEFKNRQSELNDLLNNLKQAIKKWDESPKYKAISQMKLMAFEEQHNKYLAARSELDSSFVGGGAGAAREIRRLESAIESTLFEITHLKETLKTRLPSKER